MLLPAGAPVPHASGGPRGPGCVESPRLFARQCRLGPSSSRCVFPGGDDETGAAPSPWNKSLRSRLRLAGVYSDANEGFVRAEFTGAGGLAEVRFFLDLGFSDAGVCSSVFQPSMVGMSMERCRRTVVGIEDGRLVDLGFYLAACLLVLYSSSWSEKYGVRPRPKLLYCFLLMRLVSKHPCDGTSTDLGVLAMAPLLRCWPGQQWRTTEAAAESGCGEHKRSLGPHCNFSFVQGLLCKLVCTPVLSVCF